MRVSTLARAPPAEVIIPLSSPVHGALLITANAVGGVPTVVVVRTSLFRLKSNPASKLVGAVSPMNCGSKVVERVANRDWTFAGASLKLSLCTWQDAHVRPLP